MTFGPLSVRQLEPDDNDWIRATLEAEWGSVLVARKGELIDASCFPGHIAVADGERVGLAVFAVRTDEYEILSLSAETQGKGVGRALVQRCFEDARSRLCRRVWLTTTNNNVRAFAFYQRVGMNLCALHRDAVTTARQLKPSIPLCDDGIPIAHELEFELLLVNQGEA
jgi:ribosomal protein S18 acetylase RimI-like enzyme